jgi:hypothetical protein
MRIGSGEELEHVEIFVRTKVVTSPDEDIGNHGLSAYAMLGLLSIPLL